MNTVAILSPQVIAKIAAGEVVQRPASVVKELIENAIDAQATAIEIHLKDGGKELIHIKDNGTGIPKADLSNIFNRHATSKIKTIDDLDTLLSMGFRGEALYSIAAVSDVTLESQAKDSKEAWVLHVRCGKRLLLEPCAAKGQGTGIKVAELFFNTPARRKFLKSNSAELNQIIHVVLDYCLLYPQKKFTLTHAGRVLIDLKPAPSLKDRTAAALNLEIKNFMEADQDYPSEKMHIQAVLSNINIVRPRRDMQYIFINNRPVDHKALGFNINDVYRAILPPGVYPAFTLLINLDPSRVDANVHPTKREVRIANEPQVISYVRHLIEDTLMRLGQTKTIDPSFINTFSLEQSFSHFSDSSLQPQEEMVFMPADLFNHTTDTALPARFARAKYIGAFQHKYLLFEEGDSLLCVDQHAAQERIMFELFSTQIEQSNIESQPLLTPILIPLSVNETSNVEEFEATFKEIGIDVGLLDGQTLAIYSQPLLLKDVASSVRAVLAGEPITRCDRTTIARRACKASIVAGDALTPQQVEYQRHQLLACKDPFTCPHGRPIIVELTASFLDKQFLRT